MKLAKLQNPEKLLPLSRVIKTRLDSAERALQKELKALKTIELEILERQGKVDVLNQDLLKLQNFLSDSDKHVSGIDSAATNTTQAAGIDALDYKMGLDRRYWINYDLERETYYLQLTHDEHAEQLPKVTHARQQYKALQCKFDILEESVHAELKSRQAKVIKNQEAERQGSTAGFGGLNGRPS